MLLFSLGMCVLCFGIYVAVHYRRKVLGVVGGLAAIAFSIWLMGASFDIKTNLIGIHAIEETNSRVILEFHFFKDRDSGIRYYESKGIRRYTLAAKYDGDTKLFYQQLGKGKPAFRIIFPSDQKKTAIEVYSEFLLKNEIIPVYRPKNNQGGK